MASWLSNVSRLPTVQRLAAGAATVGLTIGLAVVPGPASGEQRPTIAAVQRQVDALEREERAARTRYAAAVRGVWEADARLAEVTAAVAAAEAKLSRVRLAIDELVAANYRSGGTSTLLRLLLAEDADTLLRSADWVDQSADYQAEALRRVAAARADLDQDRSTQARELARVTEARAGIAAEQRAVAQKATEVRKLLASLQAEERKRIQAIRQAQEADRARAAAREAKQQSATRSTRSTTAPPTATRSSSSGSCPASGSRGAEARLTAATLAIMRCGLAAFPQIEYAGGWGTRGNATDHDDGRAVDFMIPNYGSASGNDLGWALAEWATKQRNISYVIFDQMYYRTSARSWQPMSNRGSDTANHRDHVHVSVTR